MTHEDLEAAVSARLREAFTADCIIGLDLTWDAVVAGVTRVVVEACAAEALAVDDDSPHGIAERIRKLGGTP